MIDSITSRPNGAAGRSCDVARRSSALAHPVAAACARGTWRCRPACPAAPRDLLERVPERVLERRSPAPGRARCRRASRTARGAARRCRPRAPGRRPGRAEIVGERLVRARLLPLGDVAARVDDEPVQPGGELRLAPELLQPDADLGERLLGGVASVLGVAQQVPGEPLDLRGVPRRRAPRARARRRPSLASPGSGRSAGRRRAAPRGAVAGSDGAEPRSGCTAEASLGGGVGPGPGEACCRCCGDAWAGRTASSPTLPVDPAAARRGRRPRARSPPRTSRPRAADGSVAAGSRPPGRAILCSVLLRPAPPMPLWPELSLVAGRCGRSGAPRGDGSRGGAEPPERRPRRRSQARRRAGRGERAAASCSGSAST